MSNSVESVQKRRKYIGVGGDDTPSLGVLEGDILRLLWDAGEAQSSVQVYQSMTESRREENKEMQSPSTIAVTLSRMVEKGLLNMQRKPNGGKGYYGPTKSRAEVVTEVLDDVSMRLTGRTLGYLLACIDSLEALDAIDTSGLPEIDLPKTQESSLAPLVKELRRMQLDCSQAVVVQRKA